MPSGGKAPRHPWRCGKRSFEFFCKKRGLEPITTWQALVRRHFKGRLKGPFNTQARDRAGLTTAFYAPLASP